ncbi:MAG: hypothetical protein BWY57_02253 [Betaproteobacteria bacterium ADurb.Bin341]|nr:MAG: hypothetical protein BWY57_02253 [Betaproteobacteria bacterium ADurb.Bin341]
MNTDDFHKHREIFLAELPPGQVDAAGEALRRVEHVTVALAREKRAIGVDYDLTEHTLAELESHLTQQGFHLDNALLNRLARALIHYIEETQLHNLEAPEKPLKTAQQDAYVTDWQQHPHGDHDETPPEWREYK